MEVEQFINEQKALAEACAQYPSCHPKSIGSKKGKLYNQLPPHKEVLIYCNNIENVDEQLRSPYCFLVSDSDGGKTSDREYLYLITLINE